MMARKEDFAADLENWLSMFNLSNPQEDSLVFDTLFEEPSLPNSHQCWFRVINTLVYGFLMICGLFANSLFCYVIWRSERLHTVTHMLMTNLALCNLLFLLFHPVFFMGTYILQTNWIFGTIMCKSSFSIVYLTATGSFYFMSLVAIDRWLAVFRRRSRLNKQSCIILTALVWLISFSVAAPYFYLSDVFNPLEMDPELRPLLKDQSKEVQNGLLGYQRTQCGIDCVSCKPKLQMITIIAQYCIPLFIMIPLYSHLSYFLWRRPTIGIQSLERSKKTHRRRKRTLMTLLAILFFLVACWTPLFSVGILHTYRLIENDSLSLYIYTSMIALFGVMLTPCFYLLNDGFRRQIIMMFMCGMELIQEATSTNFRSTDGERQQTLLRKDKENNMELSNSDDRKCKNGALRVVHYSTEPSSFCTS